MKTIEIMYKPGDRIKYYSKRYSFVEMTLTEVKVIWTKNEFKIKFAGYPDYYLNGKKHWSKKTWIYTPNNIELVKEA